MADRRNNSSQPRKRAQTPAKQPKPRQAASIQQASRKKSVTFSDTSSRRSNSSDASSKRTSSKHTPSSSHRRTSAHSSSTLGVQNFTQRIWTKDSQTSSPQNKQTNTHQKGGVVRILDYLKHAGTALLGLLKLLSVLLLSLFNRSRKTRIVGIMLVVLVVGGIGDSLLNTGKIYPGVRVGTVDVGGKTPEEASQLLNDTYQARVQSNTVTFFADESTKEHPNTTDSIASIEEQISYEESLANRTQWTTPASEVGATFDAQASSDRAFQVGRDTGGIFTRLQCLLFGYTLDPECAYNEEFFEARRISISTSVGNPRVNYGIQMNDSVAEVTEGHDGEEMSKEWFKAALDASYCSEEPESSYVVKIEHAPLQVTRTMAQETADTINNSIAQGASFYYEGATWDVSRDDLASWVTTKLIDDNGTYALKPLFKQDGLKNSLLSRASEQVKSEALHVSFDVSVNGDITVTSNTDGKVPEVSEAVNEMNESFFTKDTHTETPQISIPSIDIPDRMSFDEASSFGIIGEISSFTTQFSSGAEARNHNIRTVSGYLTNSVAKANGGSWSFNDVAGETTEELGYQNAGAIVDGEYTDEIGGGVCQVATTIYNAIYNAGYPILERHNHTLYIASYPEGRDAAIAYPYYDLRWENDTSSDILLVMSYTNTSVTATLYGVDPGYTVSTQYGEWKAGEKYSTKYKDDNTLSAGTEKVKSSGEDGREITVVRTVKDSQGNTRSEQTFTSIYDPKDEIILKGTA